MARVELVFPWPARALSPNARGHWTRLHKASKQARRDAYLLTRQAGAHLLNWGTGRLELELVFVPPDRRRRDDDNLVAAFKPYRDGLAQALGIDDVRFRTAFSVAATTRKPGCVRVTLHS